MTELPNGKGIRKKLQRANDQMWQGAEELDMLQDVDNQGTFQRAEDQMALQRQGFRSHCRG